MATSSSDAPGSSLTANEVAAAMAVAQRLGVVALDADDTGKVHQLREMELAQVLEAVYDDRREQITSRLESLKEALEGEVESLELERDQLRADARRASASRNIYRLWERVRPQVQAMDFYTAARAVDELDQLIESLDD